MLGEANVFIKERNDSAEQNQWSWCANLSPKCRASSPPKKASNDRIQCDEVHLNDSDETFSFWKKWILYSLTYIRMQNGNWWLLRRNPCLSNWMYEIIPKIKSSAKMLRLQECQRVVRGTHRKYNTIETKPYNLRLNVFSLKLNRWVVNVITLVYLSFHTFFMTRTRKRELDRTYVPLVLAEVELYLFVFIFNINRRLSCSICNIDCIGSIVVSLDLMAFVLLFIIY